jgi:hypothetical protein
MRLAIARLCLDCEEIHDADRCPMCGSETFAFLTRWVKSQAPETTSRPAPVTERPERVDTYRQLIGPDRRQSRWGRFAARGAIGVTLLGLARMAWRVWPADDTSSSKVEPRAASEKGKPQEPLS